ncbi:MFS transporter [Streptomyces sp. GC420]|nr:MFS transporter [Streptomyces sp. GC420]
MDAVPEELRGRAMTLMTAGLMAVQGVGMALAGLVAEFFGASAAATAAALTGTLCTLLLVREARRTRRRDGTARTDERDGADQHVTGR